jgi:hypothetical protein
MAAPVYHAPDGTEIPAMIMEDLKRAFAQVPDFRPSVTFPVVRWDLKLTISVYPREPQDIVINRVGAHIADDATAAEMTNTTEIVLESKNAIGAPGMLAPDEAREQYGLPVPKVKIDRKTGGMYTEMQEPAKPQDEDAEFKPAGVRSAVINKGRNRL